MTIRQIITRLKSLERDAARAAMPLGTRDEAVRWPQRFVNFDPRHAETAYRIRDWGRTYRIDWIGPWRSDEDLHAGDYMRACYYHTRWQLRDVAVRSPRDGECFAPTFLAELAPLLAQYQHRSHDHFPLDDGSLVRETCDGEVPQVLPEDGTGSQRNRRAAGAMLATRLRRLECSRESATPRACDICGAGADPSAHELVVTFDEPSGPDSCPRCGRPLVLRLEFDTALDEPITR